MVKGRFLSMQETVQNLFNESIQIQVASADSVGPPVIAAIDKLVQALLSGNKVFTCGDESNSFIAAQFAELMLHGCALERPPFAAIHLVGQAQGELAQECFARQVTALGTAGDVLVVFVTQTQNERIHQAMTAAVARDMSIITISGDDPGDITGLLGASDIEIRIPSLVRARIIEQQLFLAQTFCDAIEASIFQGV